MIMIHNSTSLTTTHVILSNGIKFLGSNCAKTLTRSISMETNFSTHLREILWLEQALLVKIDKHFHINILH